MRFSYVFDSMNWDFRMLCVRVCVSLSIVWPTAYGYWIGLRLGTWFWVDLLLTVIWLHFEYQQCIYSHIFINSYVHTYIYVYKYVCMYHICIYMCIMQLATLNVQKVRLGRCAREFSKTFIWKNLRILHSNNLIL